MQSRIQNITDKSVNFRESIDKYLRHWPWFVGSVFLALIAGFLYARSQPDTYETTASIMVLDQSKNGATSQANLISQLNNIGLTTTPTMTNDEAKMISSTALMRKVVYRLELYTSYSHRSFLKNEDLYDSSPLYVRLDMASLERIKGNIMLTARYDSGKIVIHGEYMERRFVVHPNNLPAYFNTPAGSLYIAQNKGYTTDKFPLTIKITNPSKVAKFIASGSLLTLVNKEANVIDLTLQTSNIKKGQDILKTLATVYNEDAVEQINHSAMSSANFLDGRIKLLTGELSTVERDAEQYKQSNNLTNIEADAQMYLGRSSGYITQRSTVENQLNLITYIKDFLRNPANKSALVPNLGLTDVGLVNIIQKYNDLVINREQIAQGSSEDNPALKAINLQVQTARKAILESVESSHKGLQITNQDLNTQNSAVSSKLRQIPKQEREFLEIKRQQQVKESLYLFLLQKREDASLSMAVTIPKGRLINTPDTSKQVAPRTSVILFVAFLLGLAIPASSIQIKTLMHTKIENRQDVEKITQVPVLGELGHISTDEIILNHKTAISPNSELFRLLRSNLQFVLDASSRKVIVVTSTQQGEGKTLVSINLAAILSLADKKVLLVELDLRRPRLSTYMEIEAKKGISSYLMGEDTDLQEIIKPVADYPMLDILPTGIIPPNPNELILKDRLDILISRLKEKYDYIVIDSAPVGIVSDTFLINRLADINLYVCRSRYTDKRNLVYINQIHQEGRLNHLYIVINDVSLQNHSYSYHRKYGYGYAQENT
ncbi:MAG: polysaccharide biosynthesis tyrosine autokinase [Bacteroidota bacterium]|nr:polysaccharide biosynthesis tyrosine autokinase [Bacteroidota bacterium]